MFKNLLNFNKDKKRAYFIGRFIDMQLLDDATRETFFEFQATDKATAQAAMTSFELVYTDDKLVKAYRGSNYNSFVKEKAELKEELIGLPYKLYKENTLINLNKDDNGLHQLGGPVPDGFQLPEVKSVVPFQYLGYINNEDVNFNWLPFQLHLVCPIYLNFLEGLYLDYSDPQRPIVINKEEIENATCSYDDLPSQLEVEFKAIKFGSSVDTKQNYGIGYSGIPDFFQWPMYPICPKTGKVMRFVGDFSSYSTELINSNLPEDYHYRQYFEFIDFWGGGNLYVFFQPESKTACYFIHNT